jgi:hypothetical protein
MEEIQIPNKETSASEIAAVRAKVLPYQPINGIMLWSVSGLGIVSMLMGVYLAFGLISAIYAAPAILIAPLLFFVVGFLLCLVASQWRSKHAIRLTESGIIFDKIMRYGLLDRLHREWSDVHAVDFQGHCRPKNIAEWSGLGDSALTIDFKSGGSVQLDLDALSRSTAEEVLL